jgi:periplasmic protein TonB
MPKLSRRFIAASALALVLPLAAQEAEVYRIGNGVTQPSILRKVEPKYSKKARKKKIEGTVKLDIVISTKGRVEDDIKIEKSLDPELDENAITAVKKWRFKPAMKDGAPVRVYANIEVAFRLPNP